MHRPSLGHTPPTGPGTEGSPHLPPSKSGVSKGREKVLENQTADVHGKVSHQGRAGWCLFQEAVGATAGC